MVLAQRLAFQQGVEPDHLRTVGVGLHGSRGNGLQPQIAVVCDAVVKDFAGHALHAKMLGDGYLIGAVGVLEGLLKQLFLGFEIVKEAGFGDVLGLRNVTDGEAPEAELRDERDGGFENRLSAVLGAHSFLGSVLGAATHAISFILYLLRYRTKWGSGCKTIGTRRK